MKIEVGVSNRHIHLKKETFEYLFGNVELKKYKVLKQPGEFASEYVVTIKTDKSFIERVRVMGPFRDYNQIEISKTDSIKLGINPPVRTSGDLKGAQSITVINENKELYLENAVIIANRHIHISKEKALALKVNNDDVTSVYIEGEKGGILSDVHYKIGDNSYFELHLDTDDGNAFLLSQNDEVELLDEN